jgi:hypothetical protein
VVSGQEQPVFGRVQSLRLAAILDELHHITT